MIKNPVLTGFHADPSMICVDGTFYVANSTFEYFPGVRISASTDLANWETVSCPLDNLGLLNMKGNDVSCGIWAPCLTYHDGLFYLVFTDVKTWKVNPFRDTHNYITTAKTITGPWSTPVYVNSSGFDPSLFHDDDGRKYFVNMEHDYRKTGAECFSGILVTELDPVTLQPISETRKVFKGSALGCVEGPHIYKKDGWYYLFAAEGGTEYSHAETVARSRNIYGPYEMHPNTHLLTTKDAPCSYLQKTGHASICQGPDGRWWTAFLCGRPVDESKRCILGRETAINEIIWENDWPYLKNGTLVPDAEFEGYGEQKKQTRFDYDFGSKAFTFDFNSLRIPAKTEVLGNGNLRIYGGESILSNHSQNLCVRRQTDFCFQATTTLKLTSTDFQQMAGLIYRYDEFAQYYLFLSRMEEKGLCLSLVKIDHDGYELPLNGKEILCPCDTVTLRLTVHRTTGRFSYSFDGETFIEIPYDIDATIISDEYAALGFTGAFVGMACQDMNRKTAYADFSKFTYEVLES